MAKTQEVGNRVEKPLVTICRIGVVARRTTAEYRGEAIRHRIAELSLPVAQVARMQCVQGIDYLGPPRAGGQIVGVAELDVVKVNQGSSGTSRQELKVELIGRSV